MLFIKVFRILQEEAQAKKNIGQVFSVQVFKTLEGVDQSTYILYSVVHSVYV